jgi:spore germination protein KA
MNNHSTQYSFNKGQQNIEIVSNDINKNLLFIQESMSQTEDLMVKELFINSHKYLLIYLAPMIEEKTINTIIIEPLSRLKEGAIEQIAKNSSFQLSSEINEITNKLMLGSCIILEENQSFVYIASVPTYHERSIEEPINEKTTKGSHEGFVESLDTNIHLIRKRIKSPLLKVKYFKGGNISNTKIGLIYIDKLTNQTIVDEIEKRISSIDIDMLVSTGNLEELIEDTSFSPFPQILNTERPDRTVSYLNEGKITLIVDGDPRVLILPITFFAFYQSSDDYTSRWWIGSTLRFIRFFGFIIAISFPAIYIAIVSFHSEVLPIGVLYTVRVGLEYVPFPPFLEALVMQIILELLKEASIRLPTPVAQTIGIVGGLVIGTAVVESNLISNTMIVVIGFTAIASFVIPVEEMGTSVRLLGFPMMVAAALFGFFGIVMMFMLLFIHLSKLESFGSPYFAPLAPLKIKELKDSFVRFPIWMLNNRPTDSKPNFIKQQWYSRTWKKK